MKAIVYTKYGLPDVLRLEEVDQPVPKEDEILIRVHAAEATKSDCELRSFNFPVKWFWLPLRIAVGIRKPKRPILGGYFAGEVVMTGKAVKKFTKGDQLFGTAGLRMGAYGEYMCLPESLTMVPKPYNMSFEEAAAVPLGGLNALHFLRKANIREGEKVLINGAGGSIGVFGVQIAKSMGAEVTAVDSGIKEEMLRRIGADHFINYEEQDFTKNNLKYDVILDMVAQSSYAGCVKALAPKGHYLMANPRVSDMLNSVLTSKFTDKTVIFAFAKEKEEELLALKEMIEKEQIKSVVDKIFPMDRAAEAHNNVETEQRLGSIVITMKNSG
ncbi:NAD(P)-dependent alcohol dehydrogenase [Fulvivirgaceae bacterium BMA12]|uniref:NAD(P)-dependent alcohol dehydrogenase n=1 Tax=Agaribacillus aureus TaxID=3051825 RepID=A0ABT8LDZ5_9BACT|nr:NAD(P)-dependent alcohol dehydrogenase [Fulvivirgaceae bacterium BMA12]